MRVRLADPTVPIVDLEFRAGIAADFATAVDRLLFRFEVSAGAFGTPTTDIPAPTGVGYDVMCPRAFASCHLDLLHRVCANRSS